MKALETSRKLSKKQEAFLLELYKNGGDVKAAADMAEYSPASRAWLVRSLRDEIIEYTKASLAGYSIKAAQRLVDGLDADGTLPSSQMDTRLKAANDILDRVGVSKRQEVVSESKVLHGIVLLPAKKKSEPLEWEDHH